MKVACAATYNTLDVHKFSGSGYFMGKSLSDQDIDLVCLPVPCIASNLGGIPSIIVDGVNGKLFALGDDITLISDSIYNIFANFNSYIDLVKSSFNEYVVRLNWKSSGAMVKELFTSIL